MISTSKQKTKKNMKKCKNTKIQVPTNDDLRNNVKLVNFNV